MTSHPEEKKKKKKKKGVQDVGVFCIHVTY